MKKILFTLALLTVWAWGSKLKAQCDLEFNNLVIQIVSTQPYPDPVTGPGCEAVFNASFDIETNSGFKYLFFHSWLAADYPNPPIFTCTGSTPAADPGTSTQLGTAVDDPGKSFLDIGFIGLKDALTGVAVGVPVNVTANIATTYLHDNTVVLTQPGNSPGLTAIVTKTSATTLHFEITNVRIVVNQPCGGPVAVKTDIWGSNSNANDPKAQCYICGIGQFFNDPTITGFKNCNTPQRQYALGISTIDPTVKTITYKVYIDMNDDGNLDLPGDVLAFTSPPIQISAPGGDLPDGYSTGGPVSLPSPYSDTQPYSEKGYLILVEGAELSNSVLKYFPHPEGCIGLPVSLKSFTATRTSRNNVDLKWETATEVDAAGFALERNTAGNWQEIAFVPSQAPGGNSLDLLAYTHNDPNNTRGMSQYRIRQVDLDGRFQYSVIRAVRGDGQSGATIVYPNPSSDGRVTVVFEEAAVSRDLSLSDMTGRVVRQWKAVTNNNIQIENLVPGVYSLRILVPETGWVSTEKIVVNKR